MNNSNIKKSNSAKGQKNLWHKDGLRFECQRCGSCCRGEPGVVWMTKREAKNISVSLGISTDLFAKNYLRLINGRISLLEHSNGDCVMYDNGCSIYETRPRQCRTFPFWSSNLKNKTEWKEQKKTCPGIDKGKLHTVEEIASRLKPELNDL
ncbi:YkgJ family cysteine cluster protein [Candidatus Scalindua japonica]|uniref:YkgJ family cysteine cluster protein n=1 Tax=Candidatus Scalindua japonica TaxID=1284222 RepID=UPI000BDECF70|nr:YkgJ family cysteine cluster protein [Candidatus Scalindua japonica]